MSTSTVNDAARAFIEEVWNAPNGVSRIESWLTPNYRDHAYNGDREGLAKAVAELRAAFDDATFEVEDVMSEGSCAALRMKLRGTHTGPFRSHPATGRPIEVNVFRWLRIEEGRVAEHWALLDTSSLLRQLSS